MIAESDGHAYKPRAGLVDRADAWLASSKTALKSFHRPRNHVMDIPPATQFYSMYWRQSSTPPVLSNSSILVLPQLKERHCRGLLVSDLFDGMPLLPFFPGKELYREALAAIVVPHCKKLFYIYSKFKLVNIYIFGHCCFANFEW